jgi:hypothetical protein
MLKCYSVGQHIYKIIVVSLFYEWKLQVKDVDERHVTSFSNKSKNLTDWKQLTVW